MFARLIVRYFRIALPHCAIELESGNLVKYDDAETIKSKREKA